MILASKQYRKIFPYSYKTEPAKPAKAYFYPFSWFSWLLTRGISENFFRGQNMKWTDRLHAKNSEIPLGEQLTKPTKVSLDNHPDGVNDTSPPDPETPGHHRLDPERGWIQSAVEKMPRGYVGQTLTNPSDPDELADLLKWERRELFPKRKQLNNNLDPLADLPLLPDDRRFIQKQLFRIPRQQHDAVLAEYRRVWLTTAEAEGDENRRDNQGRRAANLYLLRSNT